MSNPIPVNYQPAPALLAGRAILITGAGDGLGRAAAVACARAGATVVLLGRTVAKLEKTYDLVEADNAPKPAIYPLNLAGASFKDYQELAITLEKEIGRLDGLVHCAAHFKQYAPLADLDPREWVESLQVNLTAAQALTQACMPLLARAPDASVVFVSDESGRKAKPFQGAYGISKAAIEQLMIMWALEMKNRPTVRFNSYDPRPMRTALRARGYASEVVEKLPPPEAAVPGLLWLLGPDSAGVSGRAC
ncbi:MAG TPA: SDR family NAD(P)-dependent oxidoreductase [Nevskiaceae bacterium]|nr:SDR family NAD(P)-dependent oxidoreductase [Nevskiaceae bacterium]